MRIFVSILIFLFPLNLKSNESLLTIQQQLERLQREVSDLSKSVFVETNGVANVDEQLATNLSSIDMRIYDLEKDVKNLTGSLEEIYFQIEDIVNKINDFNFSITSIENNFAEIKNSTKIDQKNKNELKENIDDSPVNTLGSLKINSDQPNMIQDQEINIEKPITEPELSVEDQFQLAFDNIRNKKWDEAKISLDKFINQNPENQLSGSAHYWLGELYILEKKYRDAAVVFAEGFQKYPKSIKAPDMLFKLSISLYEVGKNNDSCGTLEKFIQDYPKNKLIKKVNKQFLDYDCSLMD